MQAKLLEDKQQFKCGGVWKHVKCTILFSSIHTNFRVKFMNFMVLYWFSSVYFRYWSFRGLYAKNDRKWKKWRKTPSVLLSRRAQPSHDGPHATPKTRPSSSKSKNKKAQDQMAWWVYCHLSDARYGHTLQMPKIKCHDGHIASLLTLAMTVIPSFLAHVLRSSFSYFPIISTQWSAAIYMSNNSRWKSRSDF